MDKILELLQDGDEPALFEFHTAVLEAERRGVNVAAFRKRLKPQREGGTEIADSILSDGTHIQASLRDLPTKKDADTWKQDRGGPSIRRSKDQGASSVKFMFREGANIHPDILDYIKNTAPKRFGIPVDYGFVEW